MCCYCNKLDCACEETHISDDNNNALQHTDAEVNDSMSLSSMLSNNNTKESLIDLNLCKKGMNIGFLNVQGLCSKFSDIQVMLTAEKNANLHIFSMCETKLKSSKMSSSFKIQGFQDPFRKDNYTNGGGGILVYVKDQILAKRREDLETNDISCLWLEITPNKGKSFLVGSLYRNPSERVEWVERFEKFLDIVLHDNKEIILLGDFNKDLLNSNMHREWLILTESLGLSQLITEPTRVTNSSSTLIDHVYSTQEENLAQVHVSRIGISDHFAILCNRKLNANFKKNEHKSITYRSFKKFEEADFLNDLLAKPWNEIDENQDIDDKLDTWYTLFNETVNKHAPLKTHRIKKDIQPDWLTSDILDNMKERDKLKCQGRFEEYKLLRNQISSMIDESKKATYKNKIEQGKDDPKSIWKLFKEFGASNKNTGNTHNILGLNVNGEFVANHDELAKNFNKYFINVAAKLKEPLEHSDFSKLQDYINSKIPENVHFELPEIDETFVFNFLSSLDTSKATGLDGVGPRLLKLSAGVITKSITSIANECIRLGKFPTSWKQAKVTPLYKGGAKDEINNYRPISILPTLSKLIEKFIHKHLMEFLNTFELIHQSQSGFRPGHSTETALLLMTEQWLKALNEGQIVGTVMVDFRKAFDLVDHNLLLKKLACYKCNSTFMKLMESYLKNRTQVTSVNGKVSESGFVTCGVPQGSILGPLLFLIFINDLPLALSGSISSIDLYADDTTIYDTQTDLHILKSNLQDALLSLQHWCKQNGMKLNTDKTKVMIITTRQKRMHIDENILSLTYNDIDLNVTTCDKILGVHIDSNLTWNDHFNFICKKISSYMWLLSRIRHYIKYEHKVMFYNAYIQPHFNYCNVIWGNSSNYNLSKLVKLQKRACKLILENEYIDFETAKTRLNILSLEQSVFVNKATIMFKVTNNLIPQYVCDLFERRLDGSVHTSLRSNSISGHNFKIPKPKLNIFKNSISYSGPIIWNSIPNEIKNSSTCKAFVQNCKNWLTNSS